MSIKNMTPLSKKNESYRYLNLALILFRTENGLIKTRIGDLNVDYSIKNSSRIQSVIKNHQKAWIKQWLLLNQKSINFNVLNLREIQRIKEKLKIYKRCKLDILKSKSGYSSQGEKRNSLFQLIPDFYKVMYRDEYLAKFQVLFLLPFLLFTSQPL